MLELNIPASFARFRQRFGLSKTAVAKTLGIKPPSYEYETPNKNNNPTAKNLFKLAKAYRVSIDYLLGLTDDPTPKWEVDSEGNIVPDKLVDESGEYATRAELTELKATLAAKGII